MAPVELLIAGAGSRGWTYADWAARHPEQARVVAVAEPRDAYRERLADAHGVPEERRFRDWREAAAAGKLADAAVIATLDREHPEPALAFAGLGYALLIEKPLAPTEAECERIVAAVESAGVVAAVAHVMRYTPYTRLLRQLLAGGAVGEIVSIDHLEPVGFWHQAHSFVRGNWRREDETGPMLLAKCCHDVDWLSYVIGRACEAVSSFGSLSHFRPPSARTARASAASRARSSRRARTRRASSTSSRPSAARPAGRSTSSPGRRPRRTSRRRCATAPTAAACGRATTTSSTTRSSRCATRAASRRA